MQTQQEHKIENTELFQNFQTGDFIYGLTNVRSKFRNSLQKKAGTHIVYVDDLNNKTIFRFLDFYGNFNTTDNATFQQKYKKLNPTEQEYLQHLMTVNDEKLRIQNPIAKQNDDEQISRACKAGLYYTKVHFCIDHIDLKQAFNEEYSRTQPMINSKHIYDCFTSEELRYIKENWNVLKDNISFYVNGKKLTELPWVNQNNNPRSSIIKSPVQALVRVPQKPRQKTLKRKTSNFNKRSDDDRRKKLRFFYDSVEQDATKADAVTSKENSTPEKNSDSKQHGIL